MNTNIPPTSLTSLIPTEQANPRTADIDLLSTAQVLERINAEDRQVADAVAQAIPQIAPVVDEIVKAFAGGHRLFYFGAGTSGRLGVLDASECPPTYGTPPELVQAFIAGGDIALRSAVEGAEDSAEMGREEVLRAGLSVGDVAVGISASGQAAYVTAAMEAARAQGCFTAAITSNPASRLVEAVHQPIIVAVGPEAVAGSTRMKAGTAQKLVLNMLTTAAMIQWGKTYRNLMVDLRPVNRKLKQRTQRIVSILGGVSEADAERLLELSGYQVKPAILMARFGIDPAEAERRLAEVSGKLRRLLPDEDPFVGPVSAPHPRPGR